MTNKKLSRSSKDVEILLKVLRKDKEEAYARELVMRVLLDLPQEKREEELWKRKTNPSKRKSND